MSGKSAALVDVGAEADLAETDRLIVEVQGESVLVLRTGGVIRAVRNLCTHLDFALSDSRVSGGTLMCRRHGARFSIADGRPLSGPAVRPLTIYPVQISEGRVLIEFHASQGNLLEVARRNQQ